MVTRRLGQFRCAVGSDNGKWIRRKPSFRVRQDAALAEDDLRVHLQRTGLSNRMWSHIMGIHWEHNSARQS